MSRCSVQIVSTLCLLRGRAHAQLDNPSKASLWLKHSLFADPYNAEVTMTVIAAVDASHQPLSHVF